MFVAKVIGNVWSTKKHNELNNLKLLIVKPLDGNMKPCGNSTLAVDGGVNAGAGNTVLVVDEGGSARSIIKREEAPVRTVVCAIVDKVYKGG